jgi:hypothetical protein
LQQIGFLDSHASALLETLPIYAAICRMSRRDRGEG